MQDMPVYRLLPRGSIRRGPLKFALPGWIVRMHDALPFENFPGRQQDDFTIQPERAMIDIPQIEKKSSLPGGGVPPIHLRPACQARRNKVPPTLVWGVARQIFHEERPRADEAHVSFQHIDQLGQFIETAAPHQLPKSCQPVLVR